MTVEQRHHVVIVGGGFGGLYAAQAFKKAEVRVTLIDKRNFHLFQPLLYQVATGGLSPGDISSPLRGVLNRQKNVQVLMGEANGLDPRNKQIRLKDGAVIDYDTCIVATGAGHSYFGNDQWAKHAPGLKTVEDATEMRRRILYAFEAAERESDPDMRRAWLRFVIVGAGPTGVELAGALAELSRHTLHGDFRVSDPGQAEILLLEGGERVLPPYPPDLSEKAQKKLETLGVTVRTGTMVTDVQPDSVTVCTPEGNKCISTRTILWAAGIQSSPLAKEIQKNTGVELDRIGRVIVEPDLTVPGHPDLFVIGDLAHCKNRKGQPLPGVAPVAMQQGAYAAKTVIKRLAGKTVKPFHYFDRGSMAVIGRAAAVADIFGIRASGYFAWLIWLFVHLMYLVEFENRVLVFIQWAWNYITRNRGARLITGKDPLPVKEQEKQKSNNPVGAQTDKDFSSPTASPTNTRDDESLITTGISEPRSSSTHELTSHRK